MNQQLLNKIAQIRRRARLLVWLRALLGVLAALIIGLLVIGVLDWWFRPTLMEWRVLLFGAVGLLIAATVFRWVWPAFRWRPGQVELARRIEHVVPDLRDRLSTSVEIAEINQRESRENSPVEDILIERVYRQLQAVSPRSVARMSFARSAGLAALIAVTMFAILWWWQPTNVALGLQRLTQPWLPIDWPRRNELVFTVQPPPRISRGDSLTLLVRDRNGGPVPDVRAEVQKLSGRGISEFLQPVLSRGTPDIFHFQLDNIQQSLRIRAVGGDSRTRWFEIDVFDLPQVIDLDVRVQSVNQSIPVSQQADRPIRCRPGSKLIISGTSSVPVARAELVLHKSNETSLRWPATDRRAQETFSLNIDVTEEFGDSEFWIELQSLDGATVQHEPRWQVQLIEDKPPLATVNHQSLDKQAGVNSNLPIEFVFHDETGIRDAACRVYRSDDISPESLLSEFLVDPQEIDSRDEFEQTFAGRAVLKIGDLPGIRVGDRLAIVPSCFDSGGQRSIDQPVTIEIVSREKLLARLLERQSRLIGVLDQLASQQKSLTDVTAALTERLVTGSVDSAIAKRMGVDQRRLNRQLAGRPNACLEQSRELLQFVDRHRLHWQGLRALEQSAHIQQSIVDELLPDLNRRFLQLDNAMQFTNSLTNRNREPLLAIAALQQDMAGRLAAAADQLRPIADLQQLTIAVRRLRQEQLQIQNDTNRVAQDWLARNTRFNETAWRSLIRQQQQLVRESAKFEQQLDTALAAASRQNDPLLSTFQSVSSVLLQQPVSLDMNAIASLLEARQFGPARDRQKVVVETLGKLLALLEPTTDDATDTQAATQKLGEQLNQIIDQLQRAESEVRQFAESQTGLSPTEQRIRRGALNQAKSDISDQLQQMQDALETLTSGAAAGQVRKAIDIIEQSPSGMDANELAQESDQLRLGMQQLQRAALSLADPQLQPATDSLDLSETLRFLQQLVSIQTAISERMFNAIRSEVEFTEPERRQLLELQQEVASRFESASQPLARFQTAAALRTAVMTDYLQLLQRLENATIDGQTLYLSDRVIAGIAQLADGLAMQQMASQNLEAQPDEDSSGNREETSAGISSFEMTMLYVMQKNLHDQAKLLKRKADEAEGDETLELRQQRLDLAAAQQQLAEVTRQLLESLQQPAVPNQIPDIPDF